MSIQKDACLPEHLRFESRALRQSHRPELSSASTSGKKVRYIKGTYRMGWVLLPPPEAHFPSLFGRFLRRLGTAPI